MNELAGVRVVVTRAIHQAASLADPLQEAGAQVILLPMIEVGPPDHPQLLANAAAEANTFDWIVFTSANAVKAFVAARTETPSEIQASIATVGAVTKEAVESQGLAVRVTPKSYVAEALIEAFGREQLQDKRILIPRAAVARDIIPTELRKLGAHVEVVEAYQNVVPADARANAAQIFREPLPDWVLFASSSAVHHLLRFVGTEVFRRIRIGSIGPITSATVREYGLRIAAEADEHSSSGLLQAMMRTRTKAF